MTAEAVENTSRAFKKAMIERALGAEMSHHLGYAAGSDKPDAATNHRNGKSGKTVLTDDGPLRIEVPRDRQGEFEPKLIGKHERRFTGFDDKIIAMHARGMTVRESRAFSPTCCQRRDAGLYQRRHRCRGRGSLGMAIAGVDVPADLLRRAAREDSRGQRRAQQGDLSRLGSAPRLNLPRFHEHQVTQP
jgi:hypothetical protein